LRYWHATLGDAKRFPGLRAPQEFRKAGLGIKNADIGGGSHKPVYKLVIIEDQLSVSHT
jgi:hypothetical protein